MHNVDYPNFGVCLDIRKLGKPESYDLFISQMERTTIKFSSDDYLFILMHLTNAVGG